MDYYIILSEVDEEKLNVENIKKIISLFFEKYQITNFSSYIFENNIIFHFENNLILFIINNIEKKEIKIFLNLKTFSIDFFLEYCIKKFSPLNYGASKIIIDN